MSVSGGLNPRWRQDGQAMSLRFYPRGELWKQSGNNPAADSNPPEDQEEAVETVELA